MGNHFLKVFHIKSSFTPKNNTNDSTIAGLISRLNEKLYIANRDSVTEI
jgi:hypothetical protein